jgi:hypothetical protein
MIFRALAGTMEDQKRLFFGVAGWASPGRTSGTKRISAYSKLLYPAAEHRHTIKTRGYPEGHLT